MKTQHLLIVSMATIAGAASGAGLKIVAPMSAAVSPDNGAAEATGPTEEAGAHGQKSAKPSKSKKHKDKGAEAAASYFKFSRQFVAPVVVDGAPKAMIILDVVIELSPGSELDLYADEPKLRDAVLKALLTQSGNGALAEMLHRPELLETTRAAILESVHSVVGDEALSVLLMDVAYQPF